jgi:hypothetical protein
MQEVQCHSMPLVFYLLAAALVSMVILRMLIRILGFCRMISSVKPAQYQGCPSVSGTEANYFFLRHSYGGTGGGSAHKPRHVIF